MVMMNYYLFSWVCLLIMINNGLVEASHKAFPSYDSIKAVHPVSKIHRTGFHFQPPKHWINDPDAPMYYKGLYHLFYQYNPNGSVWGNIVWAHSVSTDMINWHSVEPALFPSKPFDIEGTWSGSATILPDEAGPAILYTGLDPQKRQVQNIALPADPSDPFLREWVKPDYNPLVIPSDDMNASFFRDPTTAWYNKGHWEMLVGGRRGRRGMAYLYRSKEFIKPTWVKAKHPLHSAPNTGMWECPDFFPVLVVGRDGVDTTPSHDSPLMIKHVLKVSLDETRFEYYTVGRYEGRIGKYFPDDPSLDGWNGFRFDYGNFYASKTFFDPKNNRRILWGWANESDSQLRDVNKGWAGIQTIPRTVWLHPNGKQLMQWPIQELETLRHNHVQLTNHKLNKDDVVQIKGITAAQADVEVVFSLPTSLDMAEPFDPRWVNPQELCEYKGSTVQGGIGPFGLLTLASEGFEEYTPVFFRLFKGDNNNHVVLMCSDASRSSLINETGMYKPSFAGFLDVDLRDRKISLRTLIDHSVVESFGGEGKTCITSRVYPSKAVLDGANLYVFNNGTQAVTVDKLDAWSMASPTNMNQPLP